VQHCAGVLQWQHEQRGRRDKHDFHFCSRRARNRVTFIFVTRGKEPKNRATTQTAAQETSTRDWKIKPAQLGGKAAELATLMVNALNLIKTTSSSRRFIL
jgi:hypothetical protein